MLLTQGFHSYVCLWAKRERNGILYEFNEVTENESTYVEVVPNSRWTPTSTTWNREPSAVSGYDTSSNLSQVNSILNTNYSDATSFGIALQSQYNEMVEKVKNAGGFWVGRYETSNMGTKQVASKRGTTSGINNETWYKMYARQSLYSNEV